MRTARGIVIRPNFNLHPRSNLKLCPGTGNLSPTRFFFFDEDLWSVLRRSPHSGFIMPRVDAGAVGGESHEFLHAPKTQEAVAAGMRKDLEPLEEMDQQEKLEELQGQRVQVVLSS